MHQQYLLHLLQLLPLRHLLHLLPLKSPTGLAMDGSAGSLTVSCSTFIRTSTSFLKNTQRRGVMWHMPHGIVLLTSPRNNNSCYLLFEQPSSFHFHATPCALILPLIPFSRPPLCYQANSSQDYPWESHHLLALSKSVYHSKCCNTKSFASPMLMHFS